MPVFYRLVSPSLALGLVMIASTSASHAAPAFHITDTFADSVSVYGQDHKRIGQVPATSLKGHLIVGQDPGTGLLQVQTDSGLVFVKPAAVQTDMTATPPPPTRCVKVGSAASDESSNSSNNLGSGC